MKYLHLPASKPSIFCVEILVANLILDKICIYMYESFLRNRKIQNLKWIILGLS